MIILLKLNIHKFTSRRVPSMVHDGSKMCTIIFVIIQYKKNILVNLIIVYRCVLRLTNIKRNAPVLCFGYCGY
jgi:hypothetical protein